MKATVEFRIRYELESDELPALMQTCTDLVKIVKPNKVSGITFIGSTMHVTSESEVQLDSLRTRKETN